jgi:hypothetical protein
MRNIFQVIILSILVIGMLLTVSCGGGGVEEDNSVTAPQISPTPGKFNSEQTITITCATDGATIHYTTDNTDPSETAGIVIANGGTFILSSTTTVKAIAYKSGMDNSAITTVNYTFQQWTWISGDDIVDQAGVYVVRGSDKPGARDSSISWSDSEGYMWLFGGYGYDTSNPAGYGELNDLWKFDPSTKKWTWISGSLLSGQSGVYGTKGTPGTSNIPGARYGSVSWKDLDGNLWLFGGYSLESDDYFNDLWKFNPSTKEWTWVSGSDSTNQSGVYGTKGTPSESNFPGARSYSISFTDLLGNLWLFGGYGYDSSNPSDFGDLNDLWKFDTSTEEWTWISGSDSAGQTGIYGMMGTASDSNIPGARCYSISWIDSDGNLWLFGGYGYDTDKDFNDLWKFNPLTGEWTWVSGSNTTGQPGAYGTMGTASNTNIPGARSSGVSWADASGNLWLFGGYGYGSSNAGDYGDLNDLWKFTPSTEEWTWVSGSDETSQLGRYGIKETPSVSNIPGARSYSISWIDLSGNLWLFGGYGYDSSDSGGYGELNDLWKFEP